MEFEAIVTYFIERHFVRGENQNIIPSGEIVSVNGRKYPAYISTNKPMTSVVGVPFRARVEIMFFKIDKIEENSIISILDPLNLEGKNIGIVKKL